MPTEPSIRGALVRQSIDWLGSLVVARRTTPQALGVHLEAEDMRLFTLGPGAEDWIPVAASARIDAALVRAHGGDVQHVMREVGGRWALRWPRPDGRHPSAPESRPTPLDPVCLLAESPPLDFGSWHTLDRTANGFEIALEGAAPLPETTRFQLEGLLHSALAQRLEASVVVESLRPSAGCIVYRGNLCEPALRPDPQRARTAMPAEPRLGG